MKESEKIRICIVVASLDIIGGQSVQALRLLEGLRGEPGVEAELLPINPRLPGPLRFLQRIKYVRTVVTSIAYIALLLARLPRFDVVHVFSASYLSFLLAPTPAILIARMYGKPVLLNYHSGEAEDHLRRWSRTAIPTMKLAHRLIVQSAYLVEVFGRFGLRAEAIFNTVDFSRFRFRRRAPLRPVLLSNRNFEKHYNVAAVLRAFALVERSVPGARLIVAGDGSERANLHALARELELKNVEFLGPVPPPEMPSLYDRADIFINASDVDNMPLSIIEAFACGLPVVTTGAGGIPYIVTDGVNGTLVACRDHEGLARNVVNLLKDDRRAGAIVEAARADSRKYTWEAVRFEWLAAYADLAGREYREARPVGEPTPVTEPAMQATVSE
ncbi:MAG TPA: glycosyltransferase family 4 protein [Blastocatellia bacterium]|nr:glycosyltransferase family 4 protein [Blastocatellia bacterium]